MNTHCHKPSILFFAATTVMLLCMNTNASTKKDIGVCVQIIEHTESDLIPKSKKLNDSSTPTKTNDVANQTVSIEEPVQTDNQEQLVASKDKKTALKALPKNNKKSSENSPAVLSKEEISLQKELASARSDFELTDKNMAFSSDVNNLPWGQTALVYMKRLVEHFVTHEPGYASTTDRCDQTITVELYPLKRGWTAFARYSGTNREERVDQLFATELSQFSERAVLALLHDVPISATIKRDNVLSADSKQQVQQVKGSNHFTINIGNKLVGAYVNQVQDGGSNDGSVAKEVHLFHPMQFGLGYRGRFENWGLEVQGTLGIGVGKKAAASNPEGGHIDYSGNTGLGIHFMRYHDPRGLMSFYFGGGAGFDFAWFSVINAAGAPDTRSYLYSGGLTADGILGWEFLRAASVQFYIQAELNLPLYISRSEHGVGSINSWMPAVTFKLGVVF